jgi:hypothetical protein
VIPRTDQFIECSDGSLEIRGVAQPLDLLTYLLNKLDAFLGVCDTLPRGADGAYLARDPRAGKIGSVRSSLEHVQMAAQVVHSSTLVPFSLRQTASDIAIAELAPTAQAAHIADLARQLIFTVLRPEAESAIPAASIDRLRNMRDRLEALVMPTQIEILKTHQAGFHRWVRGTLGARQWLETKIVPQLSRMWDEQQRLKREQEPINAEHRARWLKARDAGIPFDEQVRLVYDPELDPRSMSAVSIGRLRDEGQHDLANLAEAYFVVMLHDAGEAGNLDKLCPLLGPVDGMERPFDCAYLDRMATGLERGDTPPRHVPEAIEGMVARFKTRMPVTLAKPDGWTVEELVTQAGVSLATFHRMRDKADIRKFDRGEHGARYGPDELEKLVAFLRRSTLKGWHKAADRLAHLVNPQM